MASPSICDGYPKLHEIDVQDCLFNAVRYFKWGDGCGDTGMDVGCGNGTNSTKELAAMFPNIWKIVAIDLVSCTIEVAKRIHPDPKIEYCVADIEDSSTLTKWTGTITKLLSVNCFTYLNDQAAAFKNVYNLLGAGGEAAIQLCLESIYFDTYVDLFEQTRWKETLKNITTVVPESHTKKYDASHYLKILQDIGFQVVACEEKNKHYIYHSEEACKKALTNAVLLDLIPSDQQEEFKQALFDTFLKHSKTPREDPRLNYRVLLVFVRKLETSL